jgi:hypothetical protein
MRPLTHRPPRSFAKYLLFVLTVGLVAALATIGAAGTVGAGVDQVCPDLDTGKIDPPGDPTSLVITAPEGKVIVQVCVKAGSAQQQEGPFFIDFDPGVTETTISHPSGKEISHYSVKFADAPPPPNGTTPPNGTVPPPEVKQPPPSPGRGPAAAAAPVPPRAPSAAAAVPGVPRVTG